MNKTPASESPENVTSKGIGSTALLGRVIWALRNDLQPKPAWRGIKQRLLELVDSVVVAGCGLLLIPLATTRLLFEPVMILLRPLCHALFNGHAVDRLMAMRRNHDVDLPNAKMSGPEDNANPSSGSRDKL